MTTTRQCYFKAAGYLLWMALLFSNAVWAATLHAIIVADTLDPAIKADKDRDNIKKMVETVSQATNLQLKPIVLDGETITNRGDGPEKIRATVNALRPEPDDVVLFYYAGHGVKDWQKGQWPALELQGQNTQPEGLLRLEAVKDILEKKPQRLLLVLADTCNKVDPVTDLDRGRIPLLGNEKIAAYKVLFLESRGSIIASGAIPGQNSNGNTDGGYFTQGFLSSLAAELGSTRPNWETIMAGTAKWVKDKNPNQTSQADVQVRSVSVTGNDNGTVVNPPPVVFTPAPPIVTTQKLTVNEFDSNSTKLKPAHQSKLRKWNQGSPEAKSLGMPNVTVEGHADSRGTEEHNLDLSRKRADTVKNYLVKELGTDPNRLRVVPRGENQPVAGNETESGRALNRRVELIPESSARPVAVAEEQPKNLLSGGQNTEITPPTTSGSITPLRVCPEKTSVFGTCSFGYDSEDKKDWNIFVEEKLWFNTWTGWFFQPSSVPNSPGHFIAATTQQEMSNLITLGGRYDKFSLALTSLPKTTYSFPRISQTFFWKNNDESVGADFQNEASADREEMDVTLSYSLMRQLQLGIGFKKITQDYRFFDKKLTFVTEGQNDENSPQESHAEYEVYGPTLNIGSQVCLASFSDLLNISLFGSFSYGSLKTKWKPEGSTSNKNDITRYHSADLGVAFELSKYKPLGLKPEIRFGYRAQTFYTEIPAGDAVDTTEGFTLGLRVTY